MIWRFSPDVKLKERAPDYFDIKVSDEKPMMSLQLWSSTAKEIDPDIDGNAGWNSGVISNYQVARSPAIRFAVIAKSLLRPAPLKTQNCPGLAIADY